METFFNPQSGEIANSLKSLAVNNGLPPARQNVGVDGSSAGQAFQTSWVGLQSPRFGTLTFGRQATLLYEGIVKYDPNYNASAFGLLGASNTYSGGGAQEDNRLDSTAKYLVDFNDLVHFGALYKFNGSSGTANTAYQADLGGEYAGASLDAYYSKERSAITATSLSAAQVAGLPALGYSDSNSLAATISDNTTYALMAVVQGSSGCKFFAGYEYIKYANPKTPLNAGFVDIGGYVLAFVNNTAFANSKMVQVYWTGIRYTADSRAGADCRRITASISLPTAAELKRAAPQARTVSAAGASRLSPSTPTTDSTCTSTPTSAPCTARCTTGWPTATLTTRRTSTRPSACATSSENDRSPAAPGRPCLLQRVAATQHSLKHRDHAPARGGGWGAAAGSSPSRHRDCGTAR